MVRRKENDMMRILTILLLPLLFIATSCDSGGEGTACAINPVGIWGFSQFDIDFSEECDCGTSTCDDLFGGSILDDVSCVDISIVGGSIITDIAECNPDCVQGRTLEYCYTYESYTCSNDLVSSAGDIWVVAGDNATTVRENQSIEQLEQSIQEYLPDWVLDTDTDFGISCTVTSSITLTRD